MQEQDGEAMMETGLKNRVVLVTGANGGIGAAIAEAFAAEGAAVAVHYLSADPDEPPPYQAEHAVPGRRAADAVADRVRRLGARAAIVAGDLLDADSAAAIFNAAEEALGPVDVLINNAGHCESPDTILQIAAGTIDRHFAVNSRAPTLLMAELARRVKARDASFGRVINISTDAAQAFASQIAYGASKAALKALTRSVAIELGPLGITVNTVSPGPIQTGWITPELEEQVLPSIPVGRLGSPRDIADCVVFLASDRAGWITGQVIKVSGGHAI